MVVTTADTGVDWLLLPVELITDDTTDPDELPEPEELAGLVTDTILDDWQGELPGVVSTA